MSKSLQSSDLKYKGQKIRLKKAAKRKLQKEINYDYNVPRCFNCIRYRCGIIKKGTNYQMWCREHSIGTNPNALCDFWEDKTGAQLNP